jgi:hypothetical protein
VGYILPLLHSQGGRHYTHAGGSEGHLERDFWTALASGIKCGGGGFANIFRLVCPIPVSLHNLPRLVFGDDGSLWMDHLPTAMIVIIIIISNDVIIATTA